MANVTEKAMLARLNISQWTARKYDKKATREVAETHGTATDVGRYNKVLVAKESLQAIATAANAAREFHARNTLPWMDDGFRILPSANYFPYMERMRELRADFEREVSVFVASYADYVDDAKARLNGLFDGADYPSAWELRRRFGFDPMTMPVPRAADFRVDLGSDEETRIRAEIEGRVNAAIDGAVRDTWNRVHDVVSKMAERLRAYTGTKEGAFRDTLVENVRDLVELLPRLNVTGDAMLDRTAEEMRATLCAHDAQTLREDDGARRETAAAAEKIMADMASYFGTEAAPLAA